MMMALPLVVLLALLQASIAQPAGQTQESTATIRGRVTDKETGSPLVRAVVNVYRQGDSKGLYARTDDEGRYELEGLTPGEYSGFVEPGEHRATHLMQPFRDPRSPRRPIVLGPGERREEVDIALPRARAITVRVVDEWGGPLSGLSIKVMQAASGRIGAVSMPRRTDDQGRLRVFGLSPGSYVVCAETLGSGSSTQRPSAVRKRFLRTCYPSAIAEAAAEAVRLEGADIEGLEIRMRRGRAFTISGTVVDTTGAPAARAMVSLNWFERNTSSATSIRVGPDGRFTVSGVTPGEYAITAEIGGPERPEHRRELEVAYHPVRVDSADVSGLVVAMTHTVDVPGRVTLEDQGTPLPRPEGPGLIISARLADDWLSGSGSSTAIMGEDRRFVLDRMCGRRLLEFANVPRGWYVKAVRYDGRDVFDEPTEFRADKDGALEILLSTRGAAVTGQVFDDRGNPTRGGRVLMFPVGADPRLFDYLSSVAVNADGRYRIGPTRPGEYFLLALPPGASTPDWPDREQLSTLSEAAERITLSAEEERTLDLRVNRK